MLTFEITKTNTPLTEIGPTSGLIAPPYTYATYAVHATIMAEHAEAAGRGFSLVSRGRRRSTPRTRGRGRGRGRGRNAADKHLRTDDLERVHLLQAQRLTITQEKINGLDLEQSRQLLQRCVTRDPSMIFDILWSSAEDPAAAPHPTLGQPSWCVCQRCREMANDIERKCCGQLPEFCISMLPHMELYILEEGVLRLARRIWNDIRAVQDLPDLGENHRQFRHAAYRQFVVWQYGALGHGNRVVIPSCCVWKIRDRFPDPQGQYTGYIPTRV
ncbi:uncharacterized protein [Misgurnus anguillicaudatus]|uniref:uncharacterized protein isoform X2 n=1 Tax=Misgurnus anguillicaudatus TaxID=75329 RepID=UPI002434CAB6|nr:uncharacterized protein LOC129426666 isoform X2 [Misgurnus anguillicaudatus]XP_055075819.1 uncharacterized protein LOC129455163 isoform X2 [Misgurnus anguillicaudatus]